jgi:hypothetical protein
MFGGKNDCTSEHQQYPIRALGYCRNLKKPKVLFKHQGSKSDSDRIG